MFVLELLVGILVVGAIVSYLRFGAPWLKARGFDYHDEVQLGLMIAGYAFRDEKIKEIASAALMVVQRLENLSLSSEEKHFEAILMLSDKLLKEFNLELDREALGLLIRLAVKMLPPTKVN